MQILTFDGDVYYYKDFSHKILHRDDGPAIEYKNGSKEWWVNGNIHRTDGPARIWSNGEQQWWINGKLHRDDGPASELSGYRAWYINGKRHRIDGPAVEYDDVNRKSEWWVEGIIHTFEYWLSVIPVSEEQKILLKLKYG